MTADTSQPRWPLAVLSLLIHVTVACFVTASLSGDLETLVGSCAGLILVQVRFAELYRRYGLGKLGIAIAVELARLDTRTECGAPRRVEVAMLDAQRCKAQMIRAESLESLPLAAAFGIFALPLLRLFWHRLTG